MGDGTAGEVLRHVWDGVNAEEGSYNAEMLSIRDKWRGIRLELIMVCPRWVDATRRPKNEASCRLAGARPACRSSLVDST